MGIFGKCKCKLEVEELKVSINKNMIFLERKLESLREDFDNYESIQLHDRLANLFEKVEDIYGEAGRQKENCDDLKGRMANLERFFSASREALLIFHEGLTKVLDVKKAGDLSDIQFREDQSEQMLKMVNSEESQSGSNQDLKENAPS